MLIEEKVHEKTKQKKNFITYNTYGDEEANAALEVIKSGVLSKFLGGWNEDFYGGPKVLAFEKAWAEYFKVDYAITVNSATSGLIAAVGAVGVEPGDEVIVSPWTMCASATAILVWNAIPVFADIEKRTFNLDPKSIAQKITPRTKAIIVPDIFGHAADLNAIMALAKEKGIAVIEDAAQAPGALYHNQYVGTISDIGVYSLNYHKHIHTGEGGVCVTQNPKYAERLQLIRNHGEAVVRGKGTEDISNIVGFNFRLGEIEAAMGIEQLKKLPSIVSYRQDIVFKLLKALQHLPGLQLPIIEDGCTHVFYIIPFVINRSIITVPRSLIIEALKNEGVEGFVEGYANVHLLPTYQRKIAYGKNHFPWSIASSEVNYDKGICPVAEQLHDADYFSFMYCSYHLKEDDITFIANGFYAAWEKLGLMNV